MLTITVLENSPCPNCETTKRTLTRHGFAFEHQAIADDDVDFFKGMLPGAVLSAPIVEINGPEEELRELFDKTPVSEGKLPDGTVFGYWYGLRMDIIVTLKPLQHLFSE